MGLGRKILEFLLHDAGHLLKFSCLRLCPVKSFCGEFSRNTMLTIKEDQKAEVLWSKLFHHRTEKHVPVSRIFEKIVWNTSHFDSSWV